MFLPRRCSTIASQAVLRNAPSPDLRFFDVTESLEIHILSSTPMRGTGTEFLFLSKQIVRPIVYPWQAKKFSILSSGFGYCQNIFGRYAGQSGYCVPFYKSALGTYISPAAALVPCASSRVVLVHAEINLFPLQWQIL